MGLLLRSSFFSGSRAARASGHPLSLLLSGAMLLVSIPLMCTAM